MVDIIIIILMCSPSAEVWFFVPLGQWKGGGSEGERSCTVDALQFEVPWLERVVEQTQCRWLGQCEHVMYKFAIYLVTCQ